MTENNEEKPEIKAQCVETVTGVVLGTVVKSLIGYIAISVFKPFFDKFLVWAKIVEQKKDS